MKKILLLIPLLFYADHLFGEDGWVYYGDIDLDGKEDSLVSGPTTMFGNAGGPYILSLTSVGKKFDIAGHGEWAIERHDDNLRLWSYSHLSSGEGSLGYFEINIKSGKFSNCSLIIYAGDSGTDLGNKLYDVVYDAKNMISATRIENYTPPKLNASGLEWGK